MLAVGSMVTRALALFTGETAILIPTTVSMDDEVSILEMAGEKETIGMRGAWMDLLLRHPKSEW